MLSIPSTAVALLACISLSQCAPQKRQTSCPTDQLFRLESQKVGMFLTPGANCQTSCFSFFSVPSDDDILYALNDTTLTVAQAANTSSYLEGHIMRSVINNRQDPYGPVQFGPFNTTNMACSVKPYLNGDGDCFLSCISRYGLIGRTKTFRVMTGNDNEFYVGNPTAAVGLYKVTSVKVVYANGTSSSGA